MRERTCQLRSRWNVVFATIILAGMLPWVGCSGQVAPSVVRGVDSCRECSMVIDRVNEACGYVHDGEFVTFDSPACLLRSCDEMRHKEALTPTEIFFCDYQSGEFVAAEETVFLLTNSLPTVMNGRVLCFASVDGADSVRTDPEELLTDWIGFRRARGKADAEFQILVSTTGMSPEVVEVRKGDLVELVMRAEHLEEDLSLVVKGYPELGDLSLAATGEDIRVRFYATRPGSGFPVVGSNGVVFGRIRVSGAHTADEEAM
ncbi:MAG: hypothetical protein GY906_14320 [bacterium]|nr:hypothetical protein [bacterium]